jgi:ribosome-binding factor A
MSSQRPTRVGEQIREELTELIAREVHDPGIGFITLTALDRARPFLRRQLGRRLRLRHIPDLEFFFDESIERHDRIERILQQLQAERDAAQGGETAAITHDDVRHERDDDR